MIKSLSHDDVEKSLKFLESGYDPGIRVMSVNKFVPVGSVHKEYLYGAEVFLGPVDGITSGSLYTSATRDLMARLDRASARIICDSLRKRVDYNKSPLPDLDYYSVNISPAMLRDYDSDPLYEFIYLLQTALGPNRIIFELPESMNTDGDLDKLTRLGHDVPNVRFALDDFHSRGGRVTEVHIQTLMPWLAWVKVDYAFFKRAVTRQSYKRVLFDMVRYASQYSYTLVIEGIEDAHGRSLIREAMHGFELAQPLCIQGFGVHWDDANPIQRLAQ